MQGDIGEETSYLVVRVVVLCNTYSGVVEICCGSIATITLVPKERKGNESLDGTGTCLKLKLSPTYNFMRELKSLLLSINL